MTKVVLLHDYGVYAPYDKKPVAKLVRRVNHILDMTAAELTLCDGTVEHINKILHKRLDIENLIVIGGNIFPINNKEYGLYKLSVFLNTRLIQIDPKRGFTEENMYKAIRMLRAIT